MPEGILSSNISQQDASISLVSIERLRPYLSEDEHSLVFFVGAGASTAGNTRLPTTPELLQQVLLDALKRSREPDLQGSTLADEIKESSSQIGLEHAQNVGGQCAEVSSRRAGLTSGEHTLFFMALDTGQQSRPAL